MNQRPFHAGMASALVLALSAPAIAQDDEEEPFFIEEIITTATKREQTLQDTPVAVTVVSAQALERAQVRDVKDLQAMVPSLRISQLQTSGNTNFIIRGFGNGANNAGIEPSVGVFIDNVYRSRSSAALADFPNLERIEVLRGPQSTLFGKNASAGVISITTAKPDLNDFSGSASVTIGDDSHYLVKGDITGPLSESVAFSLSGSVNQRDGYYENLVNGDELNEWDRWNARGQLLILPSDNLEIRLIADAEEIDEACCGVANLQAGPTTAAILALGGNLVPNAPFAYEGYYDFTPTNELENAGVSMQIDYDWSEVTLTSITSFRTFDRFEDADVDFTSARLVSTNQSETEIETFTQEFRLTSTGGGSVDWLLGAFFFDETVDIADQLLYDDQFRPYGDFLTTAAVGGIPFVDPSPLGQLETALGLPAGIFFAEGQGITGTAGQDDQTFNIFGQIDWAMTDRVTLTLGANYTQVEKEAFVDLTSTDVFSGVDLVQVGFAQTFIALTGLPPTPQNIAANPQAAAQAQAISTTQCNAMTAPFCNQLLALQPLQFLPPFLAYPNAVENGVTDEDDVTWTARLAFDLTDSVNVYLSAGTGYKATSWNLSRDSRPFPSDFPALAGAGLLLPNLRAGTRFAGPEEATVYEIGLKAQFETVAVNLAIFDQEIEGFQSNIFRGTGFSLANAGKQSTTGLELDLTWYPVDNFQFTFAATVLDPEYDSFVEGEGVNGPEDLSGTQPPGIHELSISTSGTYNFEVGASALGFVRLEYVYDDEVQVIENVPASVASREVSMLNASLGIEWDNGFEALLWGRNITDDEYLQSAFPSVAQAGSFSGYPNLPASYGLTLTKHFD
ncbi:MAG: TonB-dependent receptor [Woeseiaceae bacterium]|nr:TonB-dependent receptor [Woeseiaceae bacterium]